MTDNRFHTGQTPLDTDERLMPSPPTSRRRLRTSIAVFGGTMVAAGAVVALVAGPAPAHPVESSPVQLMCALPADGAPLPVLCNDLAGPSSSADPTIIPTEAKPDAKPVDCPGTPAPGHPVPASLPH